MEMITDYVPASYVTHDMLHMMGGHQVNWLIDGVPIPNTNIATNLGPQIDPRDIDDLEVFSGSYDADYGDRTYGVFNVVPRTGFERDRDCDLVITGGNFYQTDDQISCGAHSERFAWYASGNGNRSAYGLQTPIPQVVNDAVNGYGGFASFIFNPNAKNQYRLVTSLRRDYYQIPIDPDPNSVGNQAYPSSGLHDAEVEPDGYVTFSWVHTFNPNTLLTVSPFYHYNGADYNGGAERFSRSSPPSSRMPTMLGRRRSSTQRSGRTIFRQAFTAFISTNTTTSITYSHDGYAQFSASSIGVNGGVVAEFVNDKFKVTPWFTLIAGLRETQFDSTSISEHATDPRFGGALRIPRLNWVFSGFYGYYYQAPPLVHGHRPSRSTWRTARALRFSPLHGERDIQWQYGVTIPYRNWTLTANNYETRAENWLDHNNIGESNIFWPITWAYALIQGWSLTLRSPDVLHHGQFHLAYANQIAQATSPITGGLICPVPVTSACPLDISAGTGTCRPRSEKHIECGLQRQSALEDLRFNQCLLRLGFHQWVVRDASGTVSRPVSAEPHYLRSLCWQNLRREIHRFSERGECGKSPGAAG